MRASYTRSNQTPQEPPRTAKTEDAGKPTTLEIGRLALRQAIEGGASLELLLACAGETVAILSGDEELRQMIRKRAGVKPYVGTHNK